MTLRCTLQDSETQEQCAATWDLTEDEIVEHIAEERDQTPARFQLRVGDTVRIRKPAGFLESDHWFTILITPEIFEKLKDRK